MATLTATETFPVARERQTARQGQQRLPKPLQMDQARLPRFLGWFSIGLGIAELVAPKKMARLAGTRGHRTLIRLYGLREIGAGIGLLTQRNPAPWLWARVAGDALDLTSLVRGSRPGLRMATAGAVSAVAGVTALDVICAQRASAGPDTGPAPDHAEASLLINRPPEECYRFWHDVQNLPRISNEVRSVRTSGDNRSHWSARLPGNSGQIEWDAEIVEDVPGQRISWRCLPGGDLRTSGSVSFDAAPGGRGTLVRVQMNFDHPAKALAGPVAKMIGKHPEQLIYKALRRMKQLLETGEIITIEGQPAGRRGSVTWLDQLAQ